MLIHRIPTIVIGYLIGTYLPAALLRASGVSTGGKLSVSHCPAVNDIFEGVSKECPDSCGISVSPRRNELPTPTLIECMAV